MLISEIPAEFYVNLSSGLALLMFFGGLGLLFWLVCKGLTSK